MKRILLAVVIGTMFGCMPQSSGSVNIGNGFTERTIEGCQYIEYESGMNDTDTHVYSITHKGNCTNPVHKCKCNN